MLFDGESALAQESTSPLANNALIFANAEARIDAIFAAMLRAGGFHLKHITAGSAVLGCIGRGDTAAIVLTLDFPDVATGVLVRQIKRQRPNFPVFVIAARVPTEDEVAAVASADGFFRQPLKGIAMVQAIRANLARPV